jgi:hypothetical protein
LEERSAQHVSSQWRSRKTEVVIRQDHGGVIENGSKARVRSKTNKT